MITFVPVADSDLAVDLHLSHLLYCKSATTESPRIAGRHWSEASIRGQCHLKPADFCYAVED